MPPTSNEHIDYLIVGQGLAGSLLAWQLLRIGFTVHVVDKGHDESSSRVAAGIINPVTGRYFVKSWLIDELIPKAAEIYKTLENELGITIWNDRIIYRALPDEKAINEWQIRSTRPGWGKYMKEIVPEIAGLRQFKNTQKWGITKHAAQVDLSKVLTGIRTRLKKNDLLFQKEFDYDKISPADRPIQYQGSTYKKIVFAEGAGVRFNPFFNHLPFRPVKGEVAHVKMSNLPDGSIIKNKLLFAPLFDDIYWVGSNYDHDFTDHHPSVKGKQWLENRIAGLIEAPWEIINFEAGIRPSTNDRRPIIGQHPDFGHMYIFNGFGTKGSSLIPYFSECFVEWLKGHRKLPEDVSIERFDPK